MVEIILGDSAKAFIIGGTIGFVVGAAVVIGWALFSEWKREVKAWKGMR